LQKASGIDRNDLNTEFLASFNQASSDHTIHLNYKQPGS